MPIPEPWRTINTPQESFVKFYLEDCIAGMRNMDQHSVDLIITSPPYNLGIRYGMYNDGIPREQYLNWIRQWGLSAKYCLSSKGSLFLNIGCKPSDPWIPFDVAHSLRDVFVLQNVFHWIKSIYIENSSYGETLSANVGHFKPINSKKYVNDAHEYVFQFTHNGDVLLDRLAVGAPYKDKSNVDRWKSAGSGLRCRGNTWYVPYKTIQNRVKDRPHPATFPVELAEMCIRIHGQANVKCVLDPFMGIGHTAIAAAKMGIDVIGFDIDEEYLKTAIQNVTNCLSLRNHINE